MILDEKVIFREEAAFREYSVSEKIRLAQLLREISTFSSHVAIERPPFDLLGLWPRQFRISVCRGDVTITKDGDLVSELPPIVAILRTLKK